MTVRDQDLEINRLGRNKDDSDGDDNDNNDVNVGNNSDGGDNSNYDNDSTRSRQLSGFFATPSN